MMDDDDLEELKLIFLEECLENIELLEQGLMRMGEGDSSDDTLNEVFRAAHSIKGGAATFGYHPMSELTHHMETLLDEMRAERRDVVEGDVDLLFAGLDVVQTILENSRSGGSSDHPERKDVEKKLEASVLDGSEAAVAACHDSPVPVDAAGVAVKKQWKIRFAPNTEFYKRGNDPLLLLGEVARLGDLTLTLDTSDLPLWADFDPNKNYLSWLGTLESTVDDSEFMEIFEWVDDDCKLELTAIVPSAEIPAVQEELLAASNQSAGSVSVTAVERKVEHSPAVVKSNNDACAPAGLNAKPKKPQAAGSDTATIRIATDKIDQLINMVGELVITQSMLSRVGAQSHPVDVEELRERLTDLEHHTRDLQESVMQVRMLPLSSAFSRLPRMVRDLSRKLDKDVELVLEGGTTELDKTVLERMIDPLVHLVRNSLDHGLETPDERVEAGKPRTGVLTLTAKQESGNVIIEIVDDGKGINSEKILVKAQENGIVQPDDDLNLDQINQLIFAPGFSTAEQVSDVSGRGVGMDVVRRNIVDLGGRVHVHSEFGSGTRVEIRLPLSLAILDGQLVRIADQTFVIPILSIVETLEVSQTEANSIPGAGNVCRFRGVYLPTVDVAKRFEMPEKSSGRMVVIVETHKCRTGLLVDDVLGQQQVVIKPLDKNYKPVEGLAGATIMSDGSVALILDPNGFSNEPMLADAA